MYAFSTHSATRAHGGRRGHGQRDDAVGVQVRQHSVAQLGVPDRVRRAAQGHVGLVLLQRPGACGRRCCGDCGWLSALFVAHASLCRSRLARQTYQPSVSNPFIAGLTVEQIYEVLAGSFGGYTGCGTVDRVFACIGCVCIGGRTAVAHRALAVPTAAYAAAARRVCVFSRVAHALFSNYAQDYLSQPAQMTKWRCL